MTGHILKKEVSNLREEYAGNGVVVIRNAINPYWLEVLREAVELQLHKKKALF